MKNRIWAAIVAATVLLPASAGAQLISQPPPGITVQGSGSDQPTLVDTRVTAAVMIDSKQPFSAAVLEPIVDALNLSGVSPVTTANTYSSPSQPMTIVSVGGPIADLSHLDALRTTVVAAASTIPGANTPTIMATGRIQNCAAAQQRATIAAIKAARIRASSIASAAGVRLGKLTAIDVAQNQAAAPDGSCAETTTVGMTGRPGFGSTTISATVTMTFAIK